MSDPAPHVMLVAGEESGDRHAASVVRLLRERLPGARFTGMGGGHMRAAGVATRVDSSHLGVVGLGEVLRHYGKLRRALKTMKNAVRDERPDLLICVDYKEFNLKLARHARACGVPVLFYVSPQVWAWRPGRVKDYGRAVDVMAVIFPFEVPFYERHAIPVRYVGHPLAGKVDSALDRGQAREAFGIGTDAPVVGLLPGSRANEVERLLPVMLGAARRLHAADPDRRFLLVQAGSVTREQIRPHLEAADDLPVTVVQGRTYDALRACDAVMTASGTATLEVALMGVPMAITYRVSTLTYTLLKPLVRIPHIGLVNIVAGREVVAEFVQDRARPERLAEEIEHILADPEYARAIREGLAEVRERLGEADGVARLADLVVEMLEHRGRPTRRPGAG